MIPIYFNFLLKVTFQVVLMEIRSMNVVRVPYVTLPFPWRDAKRRIVIYTTIDSFAMRQFSINGV